MKNDGRLNARMGQVQRPTYSGSGITGRKQKEGSLHRVSFMEGQGGSSEQPENEPCPPNTGVRVQSSTLQGRGEGPGGDTFGRGDVAEADLGRLIAVLIGAFPAAAGTPGGRPAPGCHVLGHGKLGWVCVGSGRTDGRGFRLAAE